MTGLRRCGSWHALTDYGPTGSSIMLGAQMFGRRLKSAPLASLQVAFPGFSLSLRRGALVDDLPITPSTLPGARDWIG